MEDTQKLTHQRWLDEQEAQLVEDFFRMPDFFWDTSRAIRWKKLKSELYDVSVEADRAA